MAPNGGNISSDCSANVALMGCIVASSAGGVGVYVDDSSGASIVCTDIHGNAGGDWVGPIAELLGQDGNICEDPLFCDPEGGDFTLAAGSPCLPDFNPDCGLMGAHGLGCDTPVAVPPAEILADGVRLWPNYPNPFNPQTTVTFALDRQQRAEVAVYDLTGKQIAVLADRAFDAGNHSVVWNGKDANGRAVPTGTYVVRLGTDSSTQAQKVLLLR